MPPHRDIRDILEHQKILWKRARQSVAMKIPAGSEQAT